MFGLVFYTGACFILSGIFTLVYMLMRPIRSTDDVQSWRVMVVMFMLLTFVPYCYVEAITYAYGEPMDQAVDDAMYEAGIDGDLLYYKLVGFRDGKARVIAVGSEKEPGNITERPVVTVSLVRDGDGWEYESAEVINSMKRNKDRFCFPPYW